MWRATWMLAALALLGGMGQAKASLIVNGGFETGDFTGWTKGAVSYPQSIVTVPVNSGTYAAQIAGYSYGPDTLSQTVATTAGQTYTLSFARYQALRGSEPSLTVTWDGKTVFSEPNPVVGNVYQTFSVNVVGTGSDLLVFTSVNDLGYTYLDDVSLNPASATPEPSTLVLVGMAGVSLAGCGLWRRKRPVTA
jgi:hypothetical protein